MPIPKIIHQVWFQFAPNKPATPPPEYNKMRQTWIDLHPGWEFKLWNGEDARNFLIEYYPEAVETYDDYKKEICRVDAIRYFLLHHYGGFYTDMDTECIKPLDELLQHKVVIVKDVNPILFLNNGFMGAEPNHPLMESCIDNLPKTCKLPDVMWQTGPLFLTGNWLFSKCKSEIVILKVRELKTYFNHYHHASWTPIARWAQALNKERRGFMKMEDVPCVLRPFLKGKVGILEEPTSVYN